MNGISDFLHKMTGGTGSMLHFSVLDNLPSGTFWMILAFSFFGTYLVNDLSQRKSFLHAVVSMITLFLGAVVGNLLLAGVRMPITNELVASGICALLGMTVTGVMLLLAYRRIGL
jgi:hypothetical protein